MVKRLSANKRAVVEWLATNKFEREPATQTALAEKLGIHHVTVSKWKKELSSEVNEEARVNMKQALPDVITALIENAKAGSYQHQKLYFEMVGEYTQGLELSGKDGRTITIGFIRQEQLDDI